MTAWMLLALGVAGATETWILQGSDSTVYAALRLEDTAMARTTGALSHPLRLGRLEGAVTLDGDEVTAVDVKGTVASLRPGDADLRKLARMPGRITEAEARFLMDCVFHQMEPEVSNEVTFVARAVEGELAALTVRGDFTLHGVTQQIEVPISITRDGDALRAVGGWTIEPRAYGFRVPSDGWSVKDELAISLDLVLLPG